MRATRRILITKTFHPITKLAQSGRGRSAGQSRTDHNDLKFAAIIRANETRIILVVPPFLLERTGRNFAVEFSDHNCCAGWMRPSKNARGKCELRRQLLVVQTERLEKARSTVGQMKGEQEQPDTVERGDVNILKPVNHHRVNIVMVERIVLQQRKVRVELAAGEMQKMKDDEGEHYHSAYDHVS